MGSFFLVDRFKRQPRKCVSGSRSCCLKHVGYLRRGRNCCWRRQSFPDTQPVRSLGSAATGIAMLALPQMSNVRVLTVVGAGVSSGTVNSLLGIKQPLDTIFTLFRNAGHQSTCGY